MSLLKKGLNSKPENLIFGIHLSGIRFMSIGLREVWSTLMIDSFWMSPIKAITQRIDCRWTSMNNPGPRDSKELYEEITVIVPEIAAPDKTDIFAARMYLLGSISDPSEDFEQTEGEVSFPHLHSNPGRLDKQSEEQPSAVPESHFSFP